MTQFGFNDSKGAKTHLADTSSNAESAPKFPDAREIRAKVVGANARRTGAAARSIEGTATSESAEQGAKAFLTQVSMSAGQRVRDYLRSVENPTRSHVLDNIDKGEHLEFRQWFGANPLESGTVRASEEAKSLAQKLGAKGYEFDMYVTNSEQHPGAFCVIVSMNWRSERKSSAGDDADLLSAATLRSRTKAAIEKRDAAARTSIAETRKKPSDPEHDAEALQIAQDSAVLVARVFFKTTLANMQAAVGEAVFDAERATRYHRYDTTYLHFVQWVGVDLAPIWGRITDSVEYKSLTQQLSSQGYRVGINYGLSERFQKEKASYIEVDAHFR